MVWLTNDFFIYLVYLHKWLQQTSAGVNYEHNENMLKQNGMK